MVLVQREFELRKNYFSAIFLCLVLMHLDAIFLGTIAGNICLKFSLLLYGIATQIFHLLESGLPADFMKKYGLSWNLLKASVGNGRGKTKKLVTSSYKK